MVYTQGISGMVCEDDIVRIPGTTEHYKVTRWADENGQEVGIRDIHKSEFTYKATDLEVLETTDGEAAEVGDEVVYIKYGSSCFYLGEISTVTKVDPDDGYLSINGYSVDPERVRVLLTQVEVDENIAHLNSLQTTPTKTKQGNTMKETFTDVLNQNKDNGIAVARVTTGKAINKSLIKLVKPHMPFGTSKFLDNALAPVVIANAFALAIKQYTNSPRAVMAADMMLEAAAFQTADAFNIDDLIDDLLDGISLPGFSNDPLFDVATAKTAALRKFAADKEIDISGVSGITAIRETITAALAG